MKIKQYKPDSIAFLSKTVFTFLVSLLFILFFNSEIIAQEIKNIRITQEGTTVNVTYDLEGRGQVFKVDLFYTTNNGQTWNGPLKSATGDVGSNILPGINKQITLDVNSETGMQEAYLQFKVVADVFETAVPLETAAIDPDSNLKINKFKTGKTISLTLALASAGTGIFATIQGNKLYDKYQTATDDAASLHSKIETYDIIAPVAFAIAGASTVSFIIYSSKHGKAKKQLSFQPVPVRNGGGLLLTYKF